MPAPEAREVVRLPRSRPHPPVYVRFGDWHPSERSRNYRTGDIEAGVSVVDTRWDRKNRQWDLQVDDSDGLADTLGGHFNERCRKLEEDRRVDPIWLVTGELVGVGGDGEPLLRSVRKVRRLCQRHVRIGALGLDGRRCGVIRTEEDC